MLPRADGFHFGCGAMTSRVRELSRVDGIVLFYFVLFCLLSGAGGVERQLGPLGVLLGYRIQF